MTLPRQKPPTIHIHGRDVAMTGNANDGYRLRIDELFDASVVVDGAYTWHRIIIAGRMIYGEGVRGIHEQAAANAVSRWFRDRARKWGYGGTIDARGSL